MNGLKWFVAVTLVAGLTAGTLSARERGGKKKSAQEPEVSQFDTMVKELKLSDPQQAQLKEKMKACEDALAAWNQANADKVKAAEEAGKKAKESKDAADRKQAGAMNKELQAARAAATADAAAAVMAILTPEQKAAWEGLQLYKTVITRYRAVDLTEDQQAKIKAACIAAAAELAASEGDEKAAKKAKGSVNDKLKWAIEVVILTPEQRQALPQRGARKKPGQ